MKAVFLDIDGVLNSGQWIEQHGADYTDTPERAIDPAAVNRLNTITQGTGAVIVISSSWRIRFSFEQLKQILHSSGVLATIYGKTPAAMARPNYFGPGISQTPRAIDIAVWLKQHPEVDRYAILDEVTEIGPLRPQLIWTDPETGLLDEHVEQAVSLLGLR